MYKGKKGIIMGINVTKLFGTNLLSTNPITAARGAGVQRTVAATVQKPGLYNAINGLDRTYGQSPVVDDMTGGLAGGPTLRHIAYA